MRCRMAGKLTPAVHVRARAREILCEELLSEGVSEKARADADCMAAQMWGDVTTDVFMRELRDILSHDACRQVLAFCNREYPLLFASLPRDLAQGYVHVQEPEHHTGYSGAMLASAAERAAAGIVYRRNALDPFPSPGSTDNNSSHDGPPWWRKEKGGGWREG